MKIVIVLTLFCFLWHGPALSAQTAAIDQKIKQNKTLHLHVEKNWLLGRIDYKNDPRFVRVSKPYTQRAALYLHRESYAAFRRLHAAARKDRIHLQILSGVRSSEDQKRIWQKKWNRLKKQNTIESQDTLWRARKILSYSAMPTSSRHHWGTDLDLNALENSYFEKRAGKKVYQWLKRNARRFGFCQVYTKKSKTRPHGYAEERWHWSYLPLSIPLKRAYLKNIHYRDIKGFSGAGLAKQLKVIEYYVGGINPACKVRPSLKLKEEEKESSMVRPESKTSQREAIMRSRMLKHFTKLEAWHYKLQC